MSDPTQRRRFLRFQLDELSAENGHHTFEHICREAARARIASNLLTATGPVSAGGDAGRDFEKLDPEQPFGEYAPRAARYQEFGALSPGWVGIGTNPEFDREARPDPRPTRRGASGGLLDVVRR